MTLVLHGKGLLLEGSNPKIEDYSNVYIYTYVCVRICTWNVKHSFINGCFNWIFSNLYIGNGWQSPNIHFKLVVWGCRYRCIYIL